MRLRIASLAAALTVLVPAAASAEAAPFRDRVLNGSHSRLGATVRQATTSSIAVPTKEGYSVDVAFTAAVPVDPALAASYVNYLDGIPHGTELAKLNILIATPEELGPLCGDDGSDPSSQTLACYGNDQMIVPSSGLNTTLTGTPYSTAYALTHEYGHHIAANRSNAPWDAYDRGTKRWASYEDVCAGVKAHTLFPGSQGAHYARNPAEAFAESYRVLNGGTWSGVVDPSLAPDATSLALLRADIVTPWPGGRTVMRRGTAPARVRIDTTLDGRLSATAPGRRIVVRDAGNGRVLGRGGRVRATICGQDAVTVAVAGRGPFKLRVTIP
jgi:hypothetical protein